MQDITILVQLSKNKVYLAVLVIALFLAEAILSLWTGLQYDMDIWFKTGLWINQGVNIYVPNDHIGYPPLWAFWCLVSYRVFAIFGNNMELWRFTIKLPMILAQFALAFVMFKFAQNRFDKKTVRKIFLFCFYLDFFHLFGLFGDKLTC